MSVALLGRREFLEALAALFAAAAAPFERMVAPARGSYLGAWEMTTLAALCDRIIPPDHDPGARALGAARYIDTLLAAFEPVHGAPRIFAGGPFSQRNRSFTVPPGAAARRRPGTDVRHFLPLTRLQELRWRAELYGSAAVPGADFNDAVLGPLTGLRQVYRQGLAKVDEVAKGRAGRPFARLAAADQDRMLEILDGDVFPPDPRRGGRTFMDLVIQHTLEGCFALPEYGGNAGGAGWRMLGLEGDALALANSRFDAARNAYVERLDHPVSTPNPDELAPDGTLRPRPLTPDGERIQRSIVTLARLLER